MGTAPPIAITEEDEGAITSRRLCAICFLLIINYKFIMDTSNVIGGKLKLKFAPPVVQLNPSSKAIKKDKKDKKHKKDKKEKKDKKAKKHKKIKELSD
jgi:hypothetical protein